MLWYIPIMQFSVIVFIHQPVCSQTDIEVMKNQDHMQSTDTDVTNVQSTDIDAENMQSIGN